MDTFTPRPGDIFLTRFGGAFGHVISAAQATIALDPSRYSHAGIVLGADVISAQPGGARRQPLAEIMAQRPLAFLPVPAWAQDRRAMIVSLAELFEGRPYRFASYLWLGLSALHIRPNWLRNRIASDDAMICSALADRVWTLAGIHLFDDGRPIGDVTPGDLAHVGDVHHYDTGPYR